MHRLFFADHKEDLPFRMSTARKETSRANVMARLLTVISLLVDPSLRSILFYFSPNLPPKRLKKT